eukprot:gene31526-53842_t
MMQTGSAIRFPSHVWLKLKNEITNLLVEGDSGCYKWYHRQLREAAEIYFDDLKFDLHKIMGMYYGNIVEPNQRKQRRITFHELTIDGKSPLDDTSKVNVRRCVEATHHMIQGEMLHEAVRELCDFGGICTRIRCGERFNIISHLISLKIRLNEQAYRESIRKEVDHYLRWLRRDIYFLSKNPFALLTVSASSQPLVSIVRKQSNNLFHTNQFKSKAIPKSFVKSTMLGGLSDFDS